MAFRKYLLIVLLVAASFGAILFLKKGDVPQLAQSRSNTHVYNNPEKSIAKIEIEVFYAVPLNKAGQIAPDWREAIKSALDDVTAFHSLQFHGLSEISYNIYPEPLALKNNDIFYDTTSTSQGNPRGLISIAEEIEERVLTNGGDLYSEAFAVKDPSIYRVLGIIYEGVGASGGLIYDTPLSSAEDIAKNLGVPESMIYIVDINSVEAFFLVNRLYLAQDPRRSYGASIFYHEFAHAIGLPDTFGAVSGPTTNDIMGTGRYRPIENTYLDKEFLKGMGILN